MRIFRLAHEDAEPIGLVGAENIRRLCPALCTTEARSELIYIDPTGIQTKLNGFSAADVGLNITRTRVVAADDSEYTYDSKNALSKPSRAEYHQIRRYESTEHESVQSGRYLSRPEQRLGWRRS